MYVFLLSYIVFIQIWILASFQLGHNVYSSNTIMNY